MRAKSIHRLSSLSDAQFFEEVSIGLALVMDHTNRLQSQAVSLHESGQCRGDRILRGIAEEEAAKYVVLLDAVRCPRSRNSEKPLFIRQLRRFNDHLSKGIYAQYYWTKPATFDEASTFASNARVSYYLDGPMDVDWIFNNEILRRRDETMYVDYVDHGEDQGCRWIAPGEEEQLAGFCTFWESEPAIFSVANALHTSGFSDARALAVVAEKWRTVIMTDGYHWCDLRRLNAETLEDLRRASLLVPQEDAVYQRIIDGWLFPLHSVRTEADTHEEAQARYRELRATQEAWAPDWY